MNPRILERIAFHADIDTRRALGIYKKLPKTNFVPFSLSQVSWRYWPDKRKAIYFNVLPKEYEFEVHEGLIFDGENWSYTEGAQVRTVWKHRNGRYLFSEGSPNPVGIRFSFGEKPQFITE